ncbi:MAG: hypothetical protein AAF721_25765, partial [Myxococcota bacterium]
PRVRAGFVHDAISWFDRFGDAGRARGRALVPPDSWTAITQARPLGWIAIDHDRHIPSAFIEVAGAERAHEFFRSLLVQQLRTPLLRSTLTATIRLFGMSPASLARAAPVGWEVVYRDFCNLRVQQRGPDSTTIVLHSVAPEVFETPAYSASFRGFFAGLLDVCDVQGDAELSVNAPGRLMEVRLHWDQPRPTVAP